MKIDILAIGAHPDDVELSCAGTLVVEKLNGKKVGVIDLTAGELGSRGDAETRKLEAAASSKILGLDVRENLYLKDGFFTNDEQSQRKLITAIRKYQPEIILCNAPEDRHPDHGKAAQLVSDASFLSGLIKIETDFNGELQTPWRPKYVFHYIQDRHLEPDFLVDITHTFDKKMASILAYKTQFYNKDIEGIETYISNPEFLEILKTHNKLLGKRIGVRFAEGFISKKNIGIYNFDAFIQKTT